MSFLRLLLMAASAIVYLGPAILVCLWSRKRAHAILQRWMRLQWKIFGIVVNVRVDESLDPTRSYLFVQLNQPSLVDTFVVPALIPAYFRAVINFEYALIPFVGWCSWAIGSLVLIRQRPKQARKKLNSGITLLQSGTSLLIAIEGRRSVDGKLQPFKKGPAVLAIEAQTSIVPIVIKGSRAALPYGSWRIRPGRIEVDFLKPVSTLGMQYSQREALTMELKKLAQTQLEK